ncbi:hypothetical protein HKD37_17G048874 [Glycine soja]
MDEYVVEDREHVKNVPELDPNHLRELRICQEMEDFAPTLNSDWPQRMQVLSLGKHKRLVPIYMNSSGDREKSKLLPLYFPWDKQEGEMALSKLPIDLPDSDVGSVHSFSTKTSHSSKSSRSPKSA